MGIEPSPIPYQSSGTYSCLIIVLLVFRYSKEDLTFPILYPYTELLLHIFFSQLDIFINYISQTNSQTEGSL